jgi:competence protein ComEC
MPRRSAFWLRGRRHKPAHYVTPVQSYLMLSGGIALLLGLVFRPAGQVVGWITWVFLTYTIEMVRLTARVPLASVPARVEGWMVWGYYGLLAGLTWWFKQPKERRQEIWNRVIVALRTRLQTQVIVGATLVLLVLAFAFWQGLPDGKLHVVFLDVGQGDAIFIETPSGKQVLIDGGPSETQVLAQLANQMPFWDRSLDMVVLTHPDADHINGLVPVLERYQVATVLHRQIALDSETYAYWLALVAEEGAVVYKGQAGLALTLTRGWRWWCCIRVSKPGKDRTTTRW